MQRLAPLPPPFQNARPMNRTLPFPRLAPSIVRFWIVALTPLTNTIGLLMFVPVVNDWVNVAGLLMVVLPQPAPVMVTALSTTTCSSNKPAATWIVCPPAVSGSLIAAPIVAKYRPDSTLCTGSATNEATMVWSAVTFVIV